MKNYLVVTYEKVVNDDDCSTDYDFFNTYYHADNIKQIIDEFFHDDLSFR